MAPIPSDPFTAAAVSALAVAIDGMVEAGMAPVDARDAAALIEAVEAQTRRMQAMQVELLAAVDRSGLHQADGHRSAKVMVRHVANLSDPEAGRRAQAARALRDLPVVRAEFHAGRLGACQVARIARAHGNKRVRQRLISQDEALAEHGVSQSYRVFDRMVSNWVELADEDGARDRAERNHQNRDVRMAQDFDGSWRIVGSCGSLQGAVLNDIFRAFVKAEFEADWAQARSDHGDGATVDHLARTDAQRRCDAFDRMCQRGADALAAAPGGSKTVTEILMDQQSFERGVAQMAGEDPETNPDRLTFGHGIGLSGQAQEHRVGYRCSTRDGSPIDPTEAVANALLHQVRRVVLGADSVVIDLGRARCFTGAAQLAVKLSGDCCYWPGCTVPVSQCQSDHLEGWAHTARGGGGRTNPGNGAPACGKHNRFKNHGFTVQRDAGGHLHVHRPDGTLVPDYPRSG